MFVLAIRARIILIATAEATMAPIDLSTTEPVGSHVAVRVVIILAAYSDPMMPTIKEMRKKQRRLKVGISELVSTYTTEPAKAPMNTPAGISDIVPISTVKPRPYVATAVLDTGSLIGDPSEELK